MKISYSHLFAQNNVKFVFNFFKTSLNETSKSFSQIDNGLTYQLFAYLLFLSEVEIVFAVNCRFSSSISLQLHNEKLKKS